MRICRNPRSESCRLHREVAQRPGGPVCESPQIFEGQLVADGYLIVKLFFHISRRSKTKRLSARATDDRLARQRRGPLSEQNYDKTLPIIDKLLELTDSADAPWHIIAAENRRVRRIEFLETLVAEIEEGLARHVKIKENPVIIPDDFPLPRTRHDLVKVQTVEEIRHDLDRSRGIAPSSRERGVSTSCNSRCTAGRSP